MSAAVLASVSNVSGGAYAKRLRVAHEEVVKRLRQSPESAGLVKLFDKHFNSSGNDAKSFDPSNGKDSPPFSAKKAWCKALITVRAVVRFNKLALVAYRKKRGCALLGCYYQKFGQRAEKLRDAEGFGFFIIGCIVVAGVLVGIQTYESMAGNALLALMDDVILYVFCFEIVVKFVAESTRPLRYFTGPDWAWNW